MSNKAKQRKIGTGLKLKYSNVEVKHPLGDKSKDESNRKKLIKILHYLKEKVVSILVSETFYTFLFFAISTWFFLSMLRFSIFLPELLKSKSAKKFDPLKEISDSNQQQIDLVFSQFGILSIYMIAPVIFIILGIFLFSLPDTDKCIYFKKYWMNIFSTTVFVVLGICISIFSVWKAS